MDVRYINPFMESTRQVFDMMLKTSVEFGKPHLTRDSGQHDVSGIIGMSGDVVGSIVLRFPLNVASGLVARFVGSEMAADSEDFSDAIGELVNMITGAAKARFEGQSVSISCPSVVIGAGHTVARPSDVVCISIPCVVDSGQFCIEVAIRTDAAGRTSEKSAAVARSA
jgi:chemotaxis protein CheX